MKSWSYVSNAVILHCLPEEHVKHLQSTYYTVSKNLWVYVKQKYEKSENMQKITKNVREKKWGNSGMN